MWREFRENVPVDGLSQDGMVGLFRIYFEAKSKEDHMKQMGLGNLMSTLGQQLQRELKPEDWRGEEH
jgi:hypothetical protein